MNHSISKLEYYTALSNCNTKSSPGLDEISYDILTKLTSTVHEFILSVLNQMFALGVFPETWRNTLVKFIPKNSGGFRPISLTSCISKLFERILQERLEFLSEKGE